MSVMLFGSAAGYEKEFFSDEDISSFLTLWGLGKPKAQTGF